MRSQEEIREERRQYVRDVEYEVYRAGGDMDGVDLDRIEKAYYHGYDMEFTAKRELDFQRPTEELFPNEYFE